VAKLNEDKLVSSLKQGLKPVYLVNGDETLLVDEACAAIRKQARAQGFEQHEIYHIESQFNWDTLLMSANSLSLFAEKKLIELRLKNAKIGDAGSKALQHFCDTPSEDTLLLITGPKFDRRTENTAWFKLITNTGHSVTIWPVNLQRLPRWIAERLRQHGLSAEPDALAILSAKVEGNLLAAAQEIEKLKLLNDTKLIDAQTMASVVMDSSRYNVFDLVDKALAGDSTSAVQCFNGLKAEGNAAPVILWALAEQIRTLLSIHEMLTVGLNIDRAMEQARVRKNRQAMIRRASQRIPINQLRWLLRRCAHADRAIKGMASGDPWNTMLDITLNLAGVNSLDSKAIKIQLNRS
jgi:DNA polymerase-3 subunit delta